MPGLQPRQIRRFCRRRWITQARARSLSGRFAAWIPRRRRTAEAPMADVTGGFVGAGREVPRVDSRTGGSAAPADRERRRGTPLLAGKPDAQVIAGRVCQVLLHAEIPLRGLDAGVAQAQLDLF